MPETQQVLDLDSGYHADRFERLTAHALLEAEKQTVVRLALSVIEEQFYSSDDVMDSPEVVKRFLVLKLAQERREVFAVLYMDSQHKVLAYEPLFFGTLNSCSVYPREVVRRFLEHNAHAVIFAHNHPSGEPEPSCADKAITKRLVDGLGLVDGKVLDHIIVGGASTVSFAEQGLI